MKYDEFSGFMKAFRVANKNMRNIDNIKTLDDVERTVKLVAPEIYHKDVSRGLINKTLLSEYRWQKAEIL